MLRRQLHRAGLNPPVGSIAVTAEFALFQRRTTRRLGKIDKNGRPDEALRGMQKGDQRGRLSGKEACRRIEQPQGGGSVSGFFAGTCGLFCAGFAVQVLSDGLDAAIEVMLQRRHRLFDGFVFGEAQQFPVVILGKFTQAH